MTNPKPTDEVTARKPDGWVWISPEGEYTGDDDTITIDRVKNVKQEELEHNAKFGYTTEPVCLISPADLDRYERLKDWGLKFKTYIECVERNTNLVEFLGDARHNPPNTSEEEYLLDLLKKILPEQGK